MQVFPMRTHHLVLSDTIETLFIRNINILVLTIQTAPEDDTTMTIHLKTVVHGTTMTITLTTVVPQITTAIPQNPNALP